MTPQEKAKELVHRFQETMFFHVTDERIDIEEAKQCALIAVDEVIKQNNVWIRLVNKGTNIYWLEVKQEIKNL
jgi:hypothetical protein